MMGDNRNEQQPGFLTEDDRLLEKNRISGIEPDSGEKKHFDKKPVIILASVAAALLAVVLILTQFVFKKPAGFKPGPGGDTAAPFEDLKRSTDALQSDNPNILRGKESYARGYMADAITAFNEVVESGAPDKDKAIALTYLGMISDDRRDYDRAIEYLNRARTYDNKNPDIYKNLAIAYRHRKDFDKALENAEKSASLNADDTVAKKILGDVYYDSGKFDEAIGQYREILDKTPDNAGVLYNMGSAQLARGDEFAAMEYFKKAGAADKIGEVAHRAYSRLGTILLERKNFTEAEAYLKQAAAIRPGDAVNHYNLGIAYLRQNKNAEAMEELTKAESLGEGNAAVMEKIGEEFYNAKNYDRSLDIFNRLRKSNERNVKILSRIADIYYQKGELDSAYEAYRRITAIEPATENARMAYVNMGIIMDDAQRFDEAIDAYEKALAISPRDAATHYNMGIAYKHAGKPELAIRSWKQAAEIDTKDPKPLVAMADYYYERGYYDLAEMEYQKVIGRWPNIPDPHFKMGTMYYKRGNYDYAINAFNRVIQLDENSDLARKAMINKAMLMTKTARGEESLEKSVNLARKALLLKPGDGQALLALGIIYMKQEKYDTAMETLFQAVKGSNDGKLVGDAYNNIGKCYFKKKQYKKALQAFTRGVEEDPSNEEIRMNRRTATQAYEAELGKE